MISSFPPRRCGVGDYTADLVHYLSAWDEVDISVLTYNEHHASSASVENGIRISRDLPQVAPRGSFASSLQKDTLDLIHLQSSSFLHSSSLTSAIARETEVPLVTTVHDTPRSWRLFYKIPSLREVYRASSRLVTHSRHVSNTLSKFHGQGRDKIIELPHGVNTSKYKPDADASGARHHYDLIDQKIALFFGFIRPGKGLETLLKAWREIERQHPDTMLVVAGGSPTQAKRYSLLLRRETDYRRRLERLASQWGLGPRIRFTGYVPEGLVPGILAASEVVVLPYDDSESQSGALLKSISAGRPVIGTRVPAFDGYVADGQEAILVPPRNSKILGRAITSLLEDPTAAGALGRRARKTAVDHFDWSVIARETINLYRRVLAITSA